MPRRHAMPRIHHGNIWQSAFQRYLTRVHVCVSADEKGRERRGEEGRGGERRAGERRNRRGRQRCPRCTVHDIKQSFSSPVSSSSLFIVALWYSSEPVDGERGREGRGSPAHATLGAALTPALQPSLPFNSSPSCLCFFAVALSGEAGRDAA